MGQETIYDLCLYKCLFPSLLIILFVNFFIVFIFTFLLFSSCSCLIIFSCQDRVDLYFEIEVLCVGLFAGTLADVYRSHNITGPRFPIGTDIEIDLTSLLRTLKGKWVYLTVTIGL